ncbi:hypothetical protein C0J52_24819, partial [Blattella germanica]
LLEQEHLSGFAKLELEELHSQSDILIIYVHRTHKSHGTAIHYGLNVNANYRRRDFFTGNYASIFRACYMRDQSPMPAIYKNFLCSKQNTDAYSLHSTDLYGVLMILVPGGVVYNYRGWNRLIRSHAKGNGKAALLTYSTYTLSERRDKRQLLCQVCVAGLHLTALKYSYPRNQLDSPSRRESIILFYIQYIGHYDSPDKEISDKEGCDRRVKGQCGEMRFLPASYKRLIKELYFPLHTNDVIRRELLVSRFYQVINSTPVYLFATLLLISNRILGNQNRILPRPGACWYGNMCIATTPELRIERFRVPQGVSLDPLGEEWPSRAPNNSLFSTDTQAFQQVLAANDGLRNINPKGKGEKKTFFTIKR